ncbi:MAG: caspase family protein [Alphaproteobacteria bacterium]|nr:caspase family protein [Alphaproteobacteria bacterium]
MRENAESLHASPVLRPLIALAVMASVATTSMIFSAATTTAQAAAAEDFLVVDCLLPGKMRKLGRKVSFVTARRALRTSQSDCELRGGEYTSYDRSDYSTSLLIWMPLAQDGDAKAQNYVGEIYEKGIGGAPQFKQAAEWYLKAAEQGLSAAQVNLGALYERGAGVEANKEKATFWYRKASGLDTANIEFVPGIKDEELQQLRRERNTAETDRDSLKNDLDKLRRQLDDAQRQLNNQSQKSSGLSDELQKARARQGAAQNPVSADSGRARELAAELEAQRANEIKMKAAIASLEKQSSQLASQLETTTSSKDQQLAEYRNEIANLRESFEAQQNNAKEKAQRVGELAKTLAASEAAHQAELTLAKRESATLQTDRAETMTKMAAEKAALEAALADARKVAANSSAKSSEMEKNLAQLEKKLQAAAPPSQPVQVAQAGPEIAIIDPPLVLTRGAQDLTAPINSPASHVVVGKVNSKSDLMMLTVNGTEVPVDKNAMFRVNVAVTAKETPVNVVAIDVKGHRRTLTFNMIKGKEFAAVAPASAASNVIDPKQFGIKFGEYHALVIGNSKYQYLPELKTAKNDAQQVSKMLKENYGFKVTTLLDASRYDILSMLNKMREELTDDQNLLIYYAGHGDLDRVNQRGNWLPVDAEPDSTANWISNIQITDVLNAMSARQIMLVVDSCYSGTLTRAGLARLDSGMNLATRGKWIQKMAEKRSRVVLTSGGVAPVLDGGGGGHSVFARAFLNALEANKGILEGQKLFQSVSTEVANSSATADFEQVPQYAPIKYAGHESGDFFLVPTRLN